MLASQVVAENFICVIITSVFLMYNCHDYSFRCHKTRRRRATFYIDLFFPMTESKAVKSSKLLMLKRHGLYGLEMEISSRHFLEKRQNVHFSGCNTALAETETL